LDELDFVSERRRNKEKETSLQRWVIWSIFGLLHKSTQSFVSKPNGFIGEIGSDCGENVIYKFMHKFSGDHDSKDLTEGRMLCFVHDVLLKFILDTIYET